VTRRRTVNAELVREMAELGEIARALAASVEARDLRAAAGDAAAFIAKLRRIDAGGEDGERVFCRCPCGLHFERGPLDPRHPRRCAWCQRSTADAVPVERP
jgi:hypothetical protein